MTLLDEIVWEPKIYPRAKWKTATVHRYADALEAGAEFPPVVIEAETMRLLDGKHRLEAFKLAGRTEIPTDEHTIPEGMSAKYYAATLSARHGDRMSNADLKALARAEFDPKKGGDPTRNVAAWGRTLGVSQSTVQGWVADLVNKGLEDRRAKAMRLTRLGWTQAEIAALLGVTQKTVSLDIQNTESGTSSMREAMANGLPEAEAAKRWNLPVTLAHAIKLDGLDDAARMERLGIKVQPYDVWNFGSCHDLMGDAHPGRIPGELVCHALYFLTKPGDLVVDPMVGSGTTLDACLLMGRKARGYDIDHRHEDDETETDDEMEAEIETDETDDEDEDEAIGVEPGSAEDDDESQPRVDIEHHDLSTGWPDTVSKAALVFWDPPYYKKMDGGTAGHGGGDGYIEDSMSRLDADAYLDFFAKAFQQLHGQVKSGTRFAFLMSDWDGENAKRPEDERGIWQHDYTDRLRAAGWTIRRQIQCPLPTQQIHPDIVTKFRASRRLARLGRYLLVAEK